MSDPDALRSIFEDHSDLEMNNLTKPNPSSSWNGQFGQYNHSSYSPPASAPSWHFPLILRTTPMVTSVVSELSAPASNNIAIASIIPTDHYSLHIYDLKDHIMWEKTSWKLGGEHALSG